MLYLIPLSRTLYFIISILCYSPFFTRWYSGADDVCYQVMLYLVNPINVQMLVEPLSGYTYGCSHPFSNIAPFPRYIARVDSAVSDALLWVPGTHTGHLWITSGAVHFFSFYQSWYLILIRYLYRGSPLRTLPYLVTNSLVSICKKYHLLLNTYLEVEAIVLSV